MQIKGLYRICKTSLTLHTSLSNTNFRGNITGIGSLSWESIESHANRKNIKIAASNETAKR